MPRGNYLYHYLQDNAMHTKKSRDEIMADVNGYTAEIFEEDFEIYKDIVSIMVVCPPLYLDGKFVKGILISQATDLFCKAYPIIKELFVPIAVSMSHGYPQSVEAEGYLTLYNNPEREAWFRKNNPDRAHMNFIPKEDADFTNEYFMTPVHPFYTHKDIDLLCVSTLSEVKNIPMLARGLKAYRRKYPENPIKMTLINGKNIDMNFKDLTPVEGGILKELEEILIHPNEYINFAGRVPYMEVSRYYSRAKATILGSLLEGKNRSIHESRSANTPIMCCKDFNQYIRGNDKIIEEGEGMYFEWDEEALADSIHQMMNSYGDFKPRNNFLKRCGRKNFFNQCIDHIDYYKQNLPDYKAGDHSENAWLNSAIVDNYQMSLHNFLYNYRHRLCSTAGFDQVGETLKMYANVLNTRSKSFDQIIQEKSQAQAKQQEQKARIQCY